jgi:hypothetical protein
MALATGSWAADLRSRLPLHCAELWMLRNLAESFVETINKTENSV